jgi:nucleoid DNA-binding protein
MAKKKKKKTSKRSASKQTAKAPTKSEVCAEIAEKTDLTKKDVAAVFDELQNVIKKNIGRRGPGMFTIPGLIKIAVKEKPAQPARWGRNPATGEQIKIAAKPKRKTIRARPLKGLKEMI